MWRARNGRYFVACLVLGGMALWSPQALGQAALPRGVETHGFVSQGFIKTTSSNYLGPSERGSFEFTEAAINFTHSPTDDLRIGLQILVHDLGPLGNYQPQFDWYYLDYRFWDWLGIRAGRTKLPFGLYNELNDVDAARVNVLLPQAVYPVTSRELLLAQTGAELYGYVPLGAAGAAEYRFYGGTIYLDPGNTSSAVQGFTVPYLVGGRLTWLSPIDGLQLGASLQALRLDFDFTPTAEQRAEFESSGQLPPDYVGIVAARVPAVLGVASVEYQMGDLLIGAEYTRSYVDFESSLLVPTRRAINNGAYALGSYRLAPWFTPGAYYSIYYPDASRRSGSAKYTHDIALTLRFDINAHWLFKVEGHFMHGTAALLPELNDGAAPQTLDRDWGVLLLKTTAYF